MPYELKNIDIKFISLVKVGANNRHIICKFVEGNKKSEELRRVAIKKTEPDKQMAYGVVYAPDEVDTHGDFAAASEIEAAAYRFMKNLNLHNVDKQHDYQPTGAFVAESWLVRKGDPIFPEEKEGAWSVGIKIEDLELWESVKKGEITALSMAGMADKILSPDDAQHNPKALAKQIAKLITNFFKKKETDMNKEEIQKLIADSLTPLKESIEKAPKPHTEENLAKIIKTALDETMKPILDRMEKLEKAAPGSRQTNDPPGGNDDPIAIGQRIAKMISG